MSNRTQEWVVPPSPRNSLSWLRPDIKILERDITPKLLPRKILKIQIIIIIRTLTEELVSTPKTVCSHQQHQHIEVMIKRYYQMRRKWIRIWKTSKGSPVTTAVTKRMSWWRERVQELNKEERLSDPALQTFVNILEKMKIYTWPEIYSSLVINKCSKKIGKLI